MKQFRVTCAKGNQKIEILIKKESSEEVRLFLRNQGYAIIDVKEVTEEIGNDMIYYFDFLVKGEVRYGQIKSWDIFKAYKKLLEDLQYKIVFIYDNVDLSEKDKQLQTAMVKENYRIYKLKTKTTKKNNKDNNKKEETPDRTYLEEKIKEQRGYIDQVIEKIEKKFNTYWDVITWKSKKFLEKQYNELKKVRHSTNIVRIYSVLEESLLMVWNVEKEIIEIKKLQERKKFLAETNILLKKMKSSRRIVADEDNKILKIKIFLLNFIFKFFFRKKKNRSSISIKIDKNSNLYFQTLREIYLYQRKLIKTRKDYFLNFFTTNSIKKAELEIKIWLIKQNLILLNKRVKDTHFSYTKILKNFNNFLNNFLKIFSFLWQILLYATYIFSIFFSYKIILFSVYPVLWISNNIISVVFHLIIIALFLKLSSTHIILFITNSILYYFLLQFLYINL